MTSPQPQFPGDAREDTAATAAAVIGALLYRAELAITAAIASLARKTAAGTMTQAAARRNLAQSVTVIYRVATPKIQAALEQAARDTAVSVRSVIAADLGQTAVADVLVPDLAPVVELIGDATQTAAASAGDALDAAIAAANDVRLPLALAAATQRLAIAAAAAEAPETAVASPYAPPLPLGAAPQRAAIEAPKTITSPYQDAVRSAIAQTRGGMPGSSLSLSRIQAAQKALDDLAAKGITGFTDKAGRDWDLASYVEMATRTAVSKAWDDLQAQAMQRSGLDLVFTYTHSTEGSCPLCVPWLGKVLSLTGDTSGYPSLDEARAAGFRHPSCRCAWHALGAGMMADVTNPVDPEQAEAAYKASQQQRALERRVRVAGRRSQAAITPQARSRARRELAAARAASAAHRERAGVVMTKVGVTRRERPYGPR